MEIDRQSVKDRQSAKELKEKAYNLGFAYEKEYRSCAQCTIAAVQDTLECPNEMLFKSASGLGAGCGMNCDGVCGGYSGGIMMMSSFFGRRRALISNDEFEKRCSFRMAKELHDLFIEEYGSCICSEIHRSVFGRTYDLWNAEEKQQFNDDGAHENKCTDVVAKASMWVTSLILKELAARG